MLSTFFSLNNCFAQKEVCSVVYTFDPPVISGKNKSETLFEALKRAFGPKNDENSIAGIIARDGAFWSLSKNLSGIQIVIAYPNDTDKLVELSQGLFRKVSENFSESADNDSKSSFIEKLLACYPSEYPVSGHEPVSVKAFGSAEKYTADLMQASQSLADFLFNTAKVSFDGNLPVIKDSQPAIIKVLEWNEVSASSFFSAKIIGEKFIKEVTSPHSPSYEIIFQPGEIRLFLTAQGSEEELFQFYPKIEKFCHNPARIISSDEWEHYQIGANKLLLEDSRDLTKSLLQLAWINHWHGKPFKAGEHISFIPPDELKNIISMPYKELHLFSRTAGSFPRIAAARCDGDKNISDIAIKLIAEKRIIDEIVKILDTEVSLSFPLSLNRKSNQTILLQFYAENENLVRIVSSLRAKILNSLALKNLINHLPSELSVSIAGTSNVPPFLLRGWLQQGWPSDPAPDGWREATIDEIADILSIEPSNKEALKRKWAFKTLTNKGKSEMLAELISRNLYIKSFDLN
ncbi:MAG: hypothetical protein Kow0029_08640 [Candidatus Rifleibacteriota bacterium]